MDTEKLEALIDAVYAIAMTILVLDLLPEQGEPLSQSIGSAIFTVLDYRLALAFCIRSPVSLQRKDRVDGEPLLDFCLELGSC